MLQRSPSVNDVRFFFPDDRSQDGADDVVLFPLGEGVGDDSVDHLVREHSKTPSSMNMKESN